MFDWKRRAGGRQFSSKWMNFTLWRWRFTDEAARNLLANVRTHGQRVRARLSGRRKDRRLAGGQEDGGLDKRLSALAAEIIAGRRVEVSWAAFRIVHFPGMDDLEAAGELGAWARRNGAGVDFEERKIRIGSREHDVLYVLFAAG